METETFGVEEVEKSRDQLSHGSSRLEFVVVAVTAITAVLGAP